MSRWKWSTYAVESDLSGSTYWQVKRGQRGTWLKRIVNVMGVQQEVLETCSVRSQEGKALFERASEFGFQGGPK